MQILARQADICKWFRVLCQASKTTLVLHCTYLYIYNTYINIHFCSKHMHLHSQTEKTCRSPVQVGVQVGVQVSQTVYNAFALWTDRFVNKDTFPLSYITREMSSVFFDISDSQSYGQTFLISIVLLAVSAACIGDWAHGRRAKTEGTGIGGSISPIPTA